MSGGQKERGINRRGRRKMKSTCKENAVKC